MALDYETPLDRIASGQSRARQIDTRSLAQGTCLVLIETAGFAMNIVLVVLGLPLFVFLLLAGWDLGLLFAQLEGAAAPRSGKPRKARLARATRAAALRGLRRNRTGPGPARANRTGRKSDSGRPRKEGLRESSFSRAKAVRTARP